MGWYDNGGGQGSSPLTRGAHRGGGQSDDEFGLIPADAGSTSFWASVTVSAAGSSPLTRGAPGRGAGAGGDPRLIPADAGSTPGR